MDNLDYYYNRIDKERNIYEPSSLSNQNRKNISEYLDLLQDPETQNPLFIEDAKKRTTNDVIDFINNKKNTSGEWVKKNTQFLNYHKSLTVYTLINSAPINNYIALHSGIGNLKNIKVADIGGGTGHAFCSFFQYPETLEYFLVDPNLRLLHDQFLSIYPKLSYLTMGHILAKAEALPFKDNSLDLAMSLSAIDHMADYKTFIKEAVRVTKIGGTIFISTHFDHPPSTKDATSFKAKLFNSSFWERITRYLYYRKQGVQVDDHTFHFKTTDPIVNELKKNNVHIEKVHTFKRYFYIIAKKL